MLVGALMGAVFAVHATPSEAACVALMKWHGYTYVAHGSVDGARAGTAIAERGVIPGLQRHGTGFVAPGTTVRIGGSACEKRGDALLITARRIARA